MPEIKETISSLYRLTRYPVDDRCDIFTHYPALKLGAHDSAVHYARKLMPLVEALVASNPHGTDWALTAPPYHAIPAAANLLSQEIFRLWNDRLASTVQLSLIVLKERSRPAHADYARLTWRERAAARERDAGAMIYHDGLAGRPVIFVNDINVTGSQQRVMRRYLAAAGAAVIHWLYIIDVERSLGQRAPRIEYEINNLQYGSFDEFADVLTAGNIEFTSKCIARTLSYDLTQLDRLFGMLSAEARSRMLQLIVREGRYNTDDFRQKVDLLTALCALDRDIAAPPESPA